jgi:hypothetical protein
MDQRRGQQIVSYRNAERRKPIWWVGLVAIGFLTLAFGGSYFTSQQINKAADSHASSAGRAGDPAPNTPADRAAPETAITGSTGAAPPAR